MFFQRRRQARQTSSRSVAYDPQVHEGRRRTGSRTVIGPLTRVRGILRGNGPVQVRGSLRGEIDISADLTVFPGGTVEAEVDVRSVQISGQARGSVRAASRVLLEPTAVFEGEISSQAIEMRPGSVLRGRARIGGTGDTRQYTRPH